MDQPCHPAGDAAWPGGTCKRQDAVGAQTAVQHWGRPVCSSPSTLPAAQNRPDAPFSSSANALSCSSEVLLTVSALSIPCQFPGSSQAPSTSLLSHCQDRLPHLAAGEQGPSLPCPSSELPVRSPNPWCITSPYNSPLPAHKLTVASSPRPPCPRSVFRLALTVLNCRVVCSGDPHASPPTPAHQQLCAPPRPLPLI